MVKRWEMGPIHFLKPHLSKGCVDYLSEKNIKSLTTDVFGSNHLEVALSRSLNKNANV